MVGILSYKGALRGHGDQVTSICTANSQDSRILLSTSRDKSLMVWKMDDTQSTMTYDGSQNAPGYASRQLNGHGQAVSDGALSAACGGDKYAISASWDKHLKLWDLEKGSCVRTFQGHSSDVNSVAFSSDSRQVVSGSRDKTIRVWNTRGECKFISSQNGHDDWVSCVRFSPSRTPTMISTSWDRTVRVWSLTTWEVKTTFTGHNGPIHNVTISPDGSLCATGGKDSDCILWDIHAEKKVYQLDTKQAKCGSVNDMCFSPSQYWLTAAMDRSVTIWELEHKKVKADIQLKYNKTTQQSNGHNYTQQHCTLVDNAGVEKSLELAMLGENEYKPYSKSLPFATCVQWDSDGQTLYVGTSNGDIHCFNQER